MDKEKFELVKAEIHKLLTSPFRDACTDPDIDAVTVRVMEICDSESIHTLGVKVIDYTPVEGEIPCD